MRIVYLISAYKHPEQLVRLVHRLDTGASLFFVHIDERADDEVYRHSASALGGLPNVHFLERHRCYWGGFGHVGASIKGINALVASKATFDYAVLLTGQDYPIKPNVCIEGFLEENNGKIFMDYAPLPHPEWERGGMDRILYWHFRPVAGYRRFLERRGYDARTDGSRQPLSLSLPWPCRSFPKGFRPFGGSSYWCFPRECIDYVCDFIEHNLPFVRFFKHVDVPDELFFQTIVLNSSLRDRVVNDDLRYIDWKDPDAPSPGVLCKDDFEKMRSSPKLFARKFDMNVDAHILDMIDRQILAVRRAAR